MSDRDRYQVDQWDDEGDGDVSPEADERFMARLTRASREMIARLSRAWARPDIPTATAGGVTTDGPQSRGKFFWRGKSCDFSASPKRYRLVEVLWDLNAKQPAAERDVSQVMQAVWDGDETSDNAFRNLLHEVRKAFRQSDIALSVRYTSGKVWLEEVL